MFKKNMAFYAFCANKQDIIKTSRKIFKKKKKGSTRYCIEKCWREKYV